MGEGSRGKGAILNRVQASQRQQLSKDSERIRLSLRDYLKEKQRRKVLGVLPVCSGDSKSGQGGRSGVNKQTGR